MTAFTQAEADLVNKAYERATTRIADLVESNAKRESEIRRFAIDLLKAHQEQIENLGFFDKDDFTPDEIKSTIEAAGAINAAEDRLDDAHEITLMELESDLAQLVQKLALDEYLFMLRGHWVVAKRYSRYLPNEIPEEVSDEFSIGLFSKTQGRLNQIAYNVRDVSRLKCLNGDDYAPGDFTGAVLNAGKYSAQEATDNYVTLQKLKAAERAAREASEISIGGQIWSVIGWDSPTDFLKDIGLVVISGGAGKVAKWGVRLKRARERSQRAAKALEGLLKIQDRARRMEDRVQDIRSAAEKLRKAKNILEMPKKIAAAFHELNKARGKIKLAEAIAAKVTKDYIRSVASSVAAKSTGLGGSVRVGEAASKELARASILAFLDGTSLGKDIKELRGKISYTLLLKGFNSKNQERLMTYFGLLTAREFIARMTITFVHKVSLAAEYVISEFIDSAAAALETILLDLPFFAEAELKMLARTIIATVRKTLAEIGKTLANKLVAA